jgi:hypothetical protein
MSRNNNQNMNQNQNAKNKQKNNPESCKQNGMKDCKDQKNND